MSTITINVLAPAQEFGALFEGIDLAQEPVTEFGPTGISVTFNNDVSALIGVAIGGAGITVGSAQVFDPAGTLVVDVPEIGLVLDAEFTPVNLAEFEAIQFVFQDFDDVLDGNLALTGVEALLQFAGDLSLEEIGADLLVDFGGGSDTVLFAAPRAAVAIQLNPDGSGLFSFDGMELTATNLERLELLDGVYAFDLTGENLGYTYRLYDAAFARTPDEAGLRFWNGVVERGEVAAEDLAQFFVDAPEFDTLFGAGLDDAGFVNALYNNVLRRDADEEGLEFWTGVFASGEQTRADMLEFFAESPENVARNEENLDDGVWLLA